MVANRPASSPKAQAAPSVDLSGLTAEEQAQIAAVMAKANAMDTDIAPSGPPPAPTAVQPRQQPPSLPPPRYLCLLFEITLNEGGITLDVFMV